eukprot:Blabericola_migrator_1__11947@NODE_730_length_6703_cov_87_523357_g526_i0_p5_GENE_NODE_730_length_6703_cov_87_523357_g526_i0NODE_730_length_6703_cov_87_523357_g526_i0_p5_ORF_typecomplete_len124_score9_26zfRING_2/PF13639_6/2_9e12zfC3HC4_2/PF13923_6/2_5e07zfRING_5/PF14634_6/7_6e07zfRING_11/PF17123_5/2e06zfC3HC4_3/PF13920_6/2_9e06ProkRING_4/PF14447_6/2_9e02ProkRING_4/PF14447_6/9_5e06zfrbx1/PF12678_7/2_4e05zfANAPC11/PF12861_7/6_8e05zfC3HC4/PF00097_25/8_5e05FANCL_C/PF11793_8/0_0053zfRING_UBOX/PF13445_
MVWGSKVLIEDHRIFLPRDSMGQSASQLPTYIYHGNPCECPICVEDIEEGQTCCAMPCLHYFHDKCLKAWLAKSTKCPCCRSDVNKLMRAASQLEGEEPVPWATTVAVGAALGAFAIFLMKAR